MNIQVMLDDHILKAQTMHSSAYIKPFEEEMKEWEDKLISMQAQFTFSITAHFKLLSLVTKLVCSGYIGCLAAMSRVVALSRADLQQRGHHEADACGGEEVQQGEHRLKTSSP